MSYLKLFNPNKMVVTCHTVFLIFFYILLKDYENMDNRKKMREDENWK